MPFSDCARNFWLGTQPNQLSLTAPAGFVWTLASDTAAASIVNTHLPSGGGYTSSQLKAGVMNAKRQSGIGDAIIELRANANATANVNTGQITATATTATANNANRTATITVVQAGSNSASTDTGCSTLLLNRESERQGANIISGSLGVLAATTTCIWTAASDVPWLILTQGASSKGTNSVLYQLQANDTATERIATLTIKGAANSTPTTLTVYQASNATNQVATGGAEGGGGDGGGDGGGGSGGGGEGAGG